MMFTSNWYVVTTDSVFTKDHRFQLVYQLLESATTSDWYDSAYHWLLRSVFQQLSIPIVIEANSFLISSGI